MSQPLSRDPRSNARRLSNYEMNELILRCAGEGIYCIDHEGRTTYLNPAGETILGWDTDEFVGTFSHQLIHHTHPDGSVYDSHECPIYAAFTDGKVHHVDDEVFWRKDGSSFPVEYESTPIICGKGELHGAVVTFRDISERKQQEEALRIALAEVQQLKERLQAENRYLRQEIKVSHNFEEIIGQGAEMTKAKRLIEQVASTNATVLILGETGVGKELFARAIHNLSTRSDRPLVKVNCAALPSSLIESELFGHEKGAFTGATSRRAGRFELADGGTIFLDEIGELPLELQAKLLRVIQEGEFERLGGSQTIKTDIRIVAATHRDLSRMILTGDFRDDLYYRLNVFPVSVPALRERREDIPQLVTHFVQKFAQEQGKTIESIPDHVQAFLQEYNWPGNIRELQNIIERAVILSGHEVLRIDGTTPPSASPARQAGEIAALSDDRRTLDQVERDHILNILGQTNRRIAGEHGAAVILDLHPNTLRSRMKKLGITT